MASYRAWNLRVLVAVVCGLLTGIILGLGIWRIVIRIQRGKSTSSSSTPTQFCRNGGTWGNGRCICTEEWKGLRCTIANFCENSTYMGFTFARIPVGRYGPSLQTCGKETPNAGNPMAVRLCNLSPYGEIELQNVTIGNCNENLETLEEQVKDVTAPLNNISSEVQILTSDANKLTAENISSATRVVGQIFNTSRNASPEAKKIAIVTVSQLLDASGDAFQQAAATANNDALTTLIEQMETYSLSLGNQSVVEPNIAIQSANFSSEDAVGPLNVRFSVQKGASSSLISGSTSLHTNVDGLNPDGQTELQVLLNMTKSNSKACGFVVYQNDKLFQSKTFTAKSNFSQKIISSKTDENEQDQSASVDMVFSPRYDQEEFQLYSYACVYWNLSTRDWDTYGCQKDKGTDGFLRCRCNHTTNFAVLMTFKKDYQYPKSLDILSNVGCALSITGLALTIIFQIVTRKVRKTSVTWVLVNLCISMLIFNLLFVFGIENSNKNLKTSDGDINDIDFDNNDVPQTDTINTPNPTCTAVAALLHYFLLVTFTWNALSAAQLYYLLIRTMKPLPQHFILFISLIGWGVPAIVVAITVGVIYSQNGKNPQWELDYRQEKICWLAIPEPNGVTKSPLLWSFIVPITIILISNVAIFITISIKVLWKNNQNLTSTKKVSSMKKIVSTLSVAVVFGITWILAYLMLINDDSIRIIFSYIFCLFNTTQGLQIFILYTVRTKIFQSEASKVLTSLSSIGKRKSFSSVTRPRLRLRMYNFVRSLPTLHEHFRLLETSPSTEEITLSESDKAKESM
ncbi:adhesion G-protein coupled receptor G7 isoform X1 [Trachypithecus francoisi]|uniref:adhesion G-protein coupled receptor G7 isoform X1 n=1 Tax=Trachypithecus francoisi TaxID=54180 RepID=UPI00141AC792|nr:adhesion G-protein coupled receptor G7 isoform X1 [Trachypithecus francoisi]